MKPEIKVELLVAEDPTFEGGSAHIATAVLTNPTVKEFTYTTELYLGVTKAATSGVGSVTIPAGSSKNVSYSIVAPVAEGEHEVYLDVWSGGVLLKHYKATENVVIEVSPDIDVGPITWV